MDNSITVAIPREQFIVDEKAPPHVDEGYDLFEASANVAYSEEESRRLRRKIDWHILPLMCIANGLNYCDKVAMGWAVLFTFKADLHLVGDNYNWASSIFYFGLLASQYPSNYFLQRFSTVKVLSGAILLWGIMMLAIVGCHSYAAILVVRFILGVAEAGVSPALLMYTSVWYTRDEQVPRTLIWSMMQGCFAIIGGLLSYGLGHITGTALTPWRYIFLVLGLLSVLLAAGWFFLMPESPVHAKWLTPEERVIAVQRVASNMTGVKSYEWKYYQMWHAIKDPKTWFLIIFISLHSMTNGGLTSFGSLVVQGLGFNKFDTLLIGLPQSIVSAGSMLVWSLLSRRFHNFRTIGMGLPLVIAIAGIASIYATRDSGANKYGRVVAYWLINSYAVTFPFVLMIIGQNVAGHTKRATTNALLFVFYAAGNIAGPFYFRTQDAPEYVLAITVILVFYCVCIGLAVGLRIYMISVNRSRDRRYGKVETMEEKLEGMRFGMHDKTDLENTDFRYML
ncbi:hypothetical protein B7463_g12209, partial [Scytalidium lignicola]